MTQTQETYSTYISCDRSLLDDSFVYHYLHQNMYWAKALTFEAFQRSLVHSALVFGVYERLEDDGHRQIGFARVISDCATFAYLTDVFIVEQYRGQGLSKRLMQEITSHPLLQGLRRFLLVTEDAAGLYAQFGFQPLVDAEHWMQIFHDH
ncbi:GNAT family N-acetyltransferase [Paenibacillus cremeus]|uniref:GNAT family N-acetyltransferase n=1 Tax=Paenibacillus cremeus TaxID=2163881 RepID=A0A559KFF0_9BACL|nr:GNAT family N-acetyltransferase [Paenibacillus cremeus]TVY10856.1 GNAT family N-acetyltransferase [Paenibacillus cremeus]